MNSTPLRGVRTAAVRVALATTAIVAVVYVGMASFVTLMVTNNLTSDIDRRLTGSLTRLGATRGIVSAPIRPPPGSPRFGPPLIIWLVTPDGAVSSNDTTAELPAQDSHVVAPITTTIGGTNVRIAGASIGGAHVIVGQTTDNVDQARSTIIVAEIIAGAGLVVVVFFGAFSIGRRVGAPIELARQRQLEFTADASHELRTPLSVIEAHTSLALAQDRPNEWYRNAFTRIDVESQRIRRLVEDLLWLARFDATKGQPTAEYVDIGVLAHQAVDRFTTIAETRDLSVALQVAGESLVVKAPPEWLDRLLGVLLDNACKYSKEGTSIAVSVTGTGGHIRLTVDDAGPGIPIHERAHIFDRFRRATDRPGGAGLGLAIADAVVRSTSGRWEIGTSAQEGASMSVIWPRALLESRALLVSQ